MMTEVEDKERLSRDEADNVFPETHDIPPVKRVFDVVFGYIVLVCASPLFVLVSIYIKLVSRGPVFYVQSRLGYGGRYFRMIKFRTLRHQGQKRDDTHHRYVSELAKSNETLKKPELSGELILGGAILRALSIDELPQLVNVLKGEMSLVGPRPDLLGLDDYNREQLRRFEVLPGLTGLWQVRKDKNEMPFSQMMELDVEYVDSQSMMLDFQIIIKTIFKMLTLSNS